MMAPLVSIAIPAYKHARFIEDCLASVCAQTYPELELVLIDDGSPDSTFELAERYLASRQNRFRRIVLERRQNQGVSTNSNACIEACQGEWVHLLGSDDVLRPEKIQRIQTSIEQWQCPDLALVHADVDYIDEGGARIDRPRRKARPQAGIEREAYRWIFMQDHFIFNPTLALHREKFLKAGGFDARLPLEDLDCWLRLSTDHAFGRVPEVLASYRKHPGNASRKRLKMLAAQFDTYANFLETHPGLIAPESIAENFRDNLRRFWRRIRRAKPWLYPSVLRSAIGSRFTTPEPPDYRRFSTLLKKSTI